MNQSAELAKTKEALITNTTTLKNQLADLADIKRALYEAEAKEMKGVKAQNLKNIKSFYSKNETDTVIAFLLNSLTKFFTGKDNTNYGEHGAEFFKTVDEFQQTVRKVNHAALDKKTIEEMMIKMCGGKEADGGEITKLMCQEENLRKYLDFFAFFKTLSKMCHLAMTERKGNVIKKKIVH